MSNALYRAWRYRHPDLDVSEESAGLRISRNGRIEMVDGSDSVRQAILLLLSTVPGERVMRPEYGCHLHRLLFSPNDATTAGLAIHYVRQAIEHWEPRIEILKLDAGQHREKPELLDIILEYRLRETQRLSALSLSINLTGEED